MGHCFARALDVFRPPCCRASLLTYVYSLIEANLVIITGCLPTLRLFLRHVAPRLIGESTARGSRKKSTGYGENSSHHVSELKTISSKRAQNYNRMNEDNISIGSEERIAAGWQGDKDSGRGILPPVAPGNIIKTETTVVRSEAAAGDNKEVARWEVGF